jgi:hypothetical protein
MVVDGLRVSLWFGFKFIALTCAGLLLPVLLSASSGVGGGSGVVVGGVWWSSV